MNVLFLETHYLDPSGNERTSAVDYWRILNPAKHLKKHTDWVIDTQKQLFEDNANPMEIAGVYDRMGRMYDVIYSSYFIKAEPYAYLKLLKEHHNTELVMDIDDDIFNIEPYNPVYQEMYGNPLKIPLFDSYLEQASYMVTTRATIKKGIKSRVKKNTDLRIEVIPNYIDLELYSLQKHIEDDVVTIAYQGGSTHLGDILYNEFFTAISFILGKYKGKVRFEMFGTMRDLPFDTLPYTTHIGGCSDYLEYVDTFKSLSRSWDIGVAPLENVLFNEGKSFIKPMEYGSQKIPVVCSPIGGYKGFINHADNGFLASTTQDWIDYLSYLIDNKKARKTMGENLYQDISNQYTIDKNIDKYINFFESICTEDTK